MHQGFLDMNVELERLAKERKDRVTIHWNQVGEECKDYNQFIDGIRKGIRPTL
jgi:hypothetical protein